MLGGAGTGCVTWPDPVSAGRSYDEKVDIFSFGIVLCEASAPGAGVCCGGWVPHGVWGQSPKVGVSPLGVGVFRDSTLGLEPLPLGLGSPQGLKSSLRLGSPPG